MAPGSRGYGVHNTIHHPDTEKRVAQIDEVRKANPDADRYEIQELLNPIEIPEKFKGKNERLGRGYK
jgi:fumarate reductase flavoprotein subunit